MRIVVIGEAPGRWRTDGHLIRGLDELKFEFDYVLEEGESAGKKQIREGATRLRERIARTRPKFALLVGNTPLIAITGHAGIKQRHGVPFEQDGTFYLPIFAPGMIYHDERIKPVFEADIALFRQMVKAGKIPVEEGLNWTIVDTERKFEEMLAALEGTVSFDIETNGLYPWAEGAQVMSLGLGTRGKQWCLPLNHHESMWEKSTHRKMLARIDARLRFCYLVAHNGKFDSLWMQVHYGLRWRCDFDTMLGHYIIDENSRHGLKFLASLYYGAPNYDVGKDTKTGGGPLYPHCLYLAHDVYYTRKLRFTIGREVDKDPGVAQVFYDLLMPCATLYVDIEFQGVFVDLSRMHEAEVHLRKQRDDALKRLNEAAASFGEVNWRSPKQLAKFFFEHLELDILDMTKKGAPSTAESVLLRLEHPAAKALLDFRSADKNLGTFIEGWKRYIVGDRMHPSFKLHGAVTGRPSCEHPNLQAVPRDQLIRSLITAAVGWVLLELDESQIEMRLAAELSGDERLLGAFDRDEDVHWLTATREIERGAGMAEEVRKTAEAFIAKYPSTPWLLVMKQKGLLKKLTYSTAMEIVYRMGPDIAAMLSPVWKELRKKAKAINFGYLYGMWWKKFKIYARDNYGVVVTDAQAQESRKAFFALYPKLATWHVRQKTFARRHGYVRALSGRVRRLPAAMAYDDSPERGAAERQAINSPVQCFANELNLMILLQLIEEFSLDIIRPIGTIHDAILAEVREDYAEQVTVRALEISKGPRWLEDHNIKLRVKIKGDAKLGPWSKGVSLEKWKEKN